MQDRLALEGEAAGAVGHQALALRRANRLTQIRLGVQAVLALAALGCVQRNHRVAHLQRLHARAYLDHDAGTFMP